MTVLVLSGTREGRDIAQQIHARGTDVITSLAGATRAPRAQGVPTRIGGFGGASGFVQFLKEQGITAVLDATHPFADQITTRSARLCAEQGVPYCLFQRPAWHPGPGDLWTPLAHEGEAAQHIAPGSRVFLATGRKTLLQFAGLSSCYVICRQIDPPEGPFPLKNGRYLVGRPPFSIEEEIELFDKYKVDWLIVKNAGGDASRSKLDAARHLGLRVGMIARPALPEALVVDRMETAVTWATARAEAAHG